MTGKLIVLLVLAAGLLALGCWAQSWDVDIELGFQWATKLLALAGSFAGAVGAGQGILRLGDSEDEVRKRGLPQMGGGIAAFVPCAAITLMPMEGNGMVALAAAAGVAVGVVGAAAAVRLAR